MPDDENATDSLYRRFVDSAKEGAPTSWRSFPKDALQGLSMIPQGRMSALMARPPVNRALLGEQMMQGRPPEGRPRSTEGTFAGQPPFKTFQSQRPPGPPANDLAPPSIRAEIAAETKDMPLGELQAKLSSDGDFFRRYYQAAQEAKAPEQALAHLRSLGEKTPYERAAGAQAARRGYSEPQLGDNVKSIGAAPNLLGVTRSQSAGPVEFGGNVSPFVQNPFTIPLSKIPPMAAGGSAIPYYQASAMRGLVRQGTLNSPVPGRTDKLPIRVPSGAYVVPADVVSSLGEGNTRAGGTVLDGMFSPTPSGAPGMNAFKAPRSSRSYSTRIKKTKFFQDGGHIEKAAEQIRNMGPLPLRPALRDKFSRESLAISDAVPRRPYGPRSPEGMKQGLDYILGGPPGYAAGGDVFDDTEGPEAQAMARQQMNQQMNSGAMRDIDPSFPTGGPPMGPPGTGGGRFGFDPNLQNALTPNSPFPAPEGNMPAYPRPGAPAVEQGISDEQDAPQEGDEDGETVPIIAAGGEHIISPEAIIAKFGDLDLGHKILDAFVKHARAEHIKALKRLPGPSK